MDVKKIVICIGLAMLSVSCSIHENIDKDKNRVAEIAQEVSDHSMQRPRYNRVTLTNNFYVPPLTKSEALMPNWYFKKVDASFSEVPFSLVVQQLLRGHSVTPKFAELNPADKQALVSISFDNEKMGEALQSLAKTAGYAFAIEGDSVVFNKFEEKTFYIATLPGQFNSQIGNDGELEMGGNSSSDSTTSTTAASMDAGNRQYSSLTISDQSVLAELKKAIESIKTAEGKVEISEMTMSIFVKDRPSAVSAIERIIDTFNEELTRTVSLDIVLLDVIYSTNNRQGFDYNLVSKLLDGKIKLKASNGSLVNNGVIPTPTQVDMEIIGGDFDGTKLFVDAVQKQADISRKIRVPIDLSNGTMGKIMSVDNTMFIAEQYGSNSTTGGIVTGGGARQETLQTGQIFNVFARAVADDVIFKLNASISAKLDIKQKIDEATGLYLESPETAAMIFDTTQILENGVTRIITGINAETINVSKTNSGYDALGFSKNSETVRKETIMLVTAKVIRGLKSKSNSRG